MKKNRLWFLISFMLISCSAGSQEPASVQVREKIKGFNYTGPARGPIPPDMISSMKRINGNYIALVPEATLYRQNLQIAYSRTGGWFGESMEATIQGIELARENGLRVMIKPHIAVGYDRSGFNTDWPSTKDSVSRAAYRKKYREYIESQSDKLLSKDRWRGSVMVKNDTDWNTLAENYTDFVMDYARLADSLDVELFCIGTELKAMALEKPAYWRELVGKIKEVYDGRLTYAANWDSYHNIRFWDELDFIGIDAYFPLSSKKNPDISTLLKNWKPYKEDIQKLSHNVGIPVVFTEWGYESEDYAAETPWVADGRETEGGGPHDHTHVNLKLQENLYRTAFQTFWNEPWFAGLFMWRWSPPEELNRGIPTYNYSPKEKPAEQVIEKWFGKDQEINIGGQKPGNQN